MAVYKNHELGQNQQKRKLENNNHNSVNNFDHTNSLVTNLTVSVTTREIYKIWGR